MKPSVKSKTIPSIWLYFIMLLILGIQVSMIKSVPKDTIAIWGKIAWYCSPPPKYLNQFSKHRSSLRFYDSREVKTPQDWQLRRQEIKTRWHEFKTKDGNLVCGEKTLPRAESVSFGHLVKRRKDTFWCLMAPDNVRR